MDDQLRSSLEKRREQSRQRLCGRLIGLNIFGLGGIASSAVANAVDHSNRFNMGAYASLTVALVGSLGSLTMHASDNLPARLRFRQQDRAITYGTAVPGTAEFKAFMASVQQREDAIAQKPHL